MNTSFLWSFRTGAGAAALLALTAGARTADAQTALAGDLDYAVPIDSSADTGAGFGVRLGHQVRAPLIVVTPEIAFTYHTFSGDYANKAYRGTGGLRLGFGEIVRPGAFAHLGVGRLEAEGPGPAPSHTAFTYDAGVFLDFTLLPIVNIGAHAAYNHLNGNDNPAFVWATFGLHAALVF